MLFVYNIHNMSYDTLSAAGRHIIEPGTPIMGGVFLADVALVVDFNENPDPYEKLFDQASASITDRQLSSGLHIARTVNEAVQDAVPYSTEAKGKVLQAEAHSRGLFTLDARHAVGLSSFIDEGGTCQEQILVIGTIFELLQMRRGIGGIASVVHSKAAKGKPDRHVDLEYIRGKERVVINSFKNRINRYTTD
jgi:hypothetical protein